MNSSGSYSLSQLVYIFPRMILSPREVRLDAALEVVKSKHCTVALLTGSKFYGTAHFRYDLSLSSRAQGRRVRQVPSINRVIIVALIATEVTNAK